jgi:RimJ/RimL family protein N-acetyltransferase
VVVVHREQLTATLGDSLVGKMNVKPSGALVPGVAPPESIDLGDIVMRRWQPDDLMARFAAVTRSYRALQLWMEWASEPITLEQQRAYGQTMAVSWPDPEGSCTYGIFDRGGAVLGGIGLHDNIGPGALEIGYWCHIDHVGRGIITRSAGALTDIALALPGIDRVEIHCDKANVRSAAVARRLGYRLNRAEPRPVRAPAESGLLMVWVKPSALVQ